MGMTVTIGLLSIIIWTWFILYWGAYAKTPERTTNLHGWFIDMDHSALGAAVLNATEQNIALDTKYKLSWDIIDASTFKSYDEIPAAIVDEQAWIAIVGMSPQYITF